MCLYVFACTVDPQLSIPQVSGRLDYPDWVVTVQLEYFANKSVCLLKYLNEVLNVWGSII